MLTCFHNVKSEKLRIASFPVIKKEKQCKPELTFMTGLRKKNYSVCTSSTPSPDRRGVLGDEHTVALRRTLKSQESRGAALKGQKSKYGLDHRTTSVFALQ